MNDLTQRIESIALPLGALAGGLALFGVFVWFGGHDPVEAWSLLFLGAFGDCVLDPEHACSARRR